MMRFAANLSTMFGEWPFPDRIDAAADAGFSSVECQFPYDWPADRIAARLAARNVEMVLINAPAGDWAAGERGLAALPGAREQVNASLDAALAYASATGTRKVHLLAGIADAHDPAARAAYAESLALAADRLGAAGVMLLIEPLNALDVPGYFLNDFSQAEELICSAQLPTLRLQFDVYHRQMIHGNVIAGLRQTAGLIGHVQTAGVPGRHEPGSGELDDARIFAELDALGYHDAIGCEYVPRAGTLAGLGWMDRFR